MKQQYSTYRTLLAPVSGQGISEAEAKDILRQVLPRLNELHDLQQSHGSISLDTVAYDYSSMEIILLDTNGTNHAIYLAPEISQTQQATPAADIYALGVVLIVLLTGFPPEALKASNDTWNWQELCTVSDQFMQILNIALLAETTSRFFNAGQMLLSLQPVIYPSEPTVTSLSNNYGTLLFSPTLLKNFSSKQSSLPVPLAAESDSLESLSSGTNYSHKTKKHKVNFSNYPIYRKAKDSKNLSKATNKGRIRVFLALLLGIGVTLSGSVGTYFYMKLKSTSIAEKNLEFFNTIYQSMDKAISQINEEKNADKDASKSITLVKEDKLIALAKAKYENAGNLNESKTILQAIPFDSPMRSDADQMLTQWQEDIKKNNDLIQKAERATKDEKWQTAIDTVKGISSTPYWKLRGNLIIAEAKQQLIAEAKQPSVANNVTAPTPQAVVYPLPNVDPIRTPSTEIYNPPAETYNPPAETYTPASDRSSPPVPPAPRVAR
ncbi:MAG: hypothetical protein DCF20_13705 [Pseudanabaena sp.]|nr:MAG: hypothetical protein DCF20_13705 [Pseudanabaena sp.]